MTISGQEATFLAGGKIFIPIPQSGSNGVSSITLQEEEQSDIWELWALPIVPETQTVGKPRMLADLSKAKLNEIRGMCWSPDGRAVCLAHKGELVRIDTGTGAKTVLSTQAPPEALRRTRS